MTKDTEKNSPEEYTKGDLQTKPRISQPPMYKVLLLNDDFTPMDFVVHILEDIFHKTAQEATEIMLSVHRSGIGLCGIFTLEVAEVKSNMVIECARKSGHPLLCEIKKA